MRYTKSRPASRINSGGVVSAVLADRNNPICSAKAVMDNEGPVRFLERTNQWIWENKLGADHVHDVVNGNNGLGLNAAGKHSIRSVK